MEKVNGRLIITLSEVNSNGLDGVYKTNFSDIDECVKFISLIGPVDRLLYLIAMFQIKLLIKIFL